MKAESETLRALLELAHEVPITVTGRSMRPAIRSGDRVWLRALNSGETPRRGSVVAVHVGAHFVLHRVRRVRGTELYVMGDATGQADGWFAIENVIGVVTRVEPSSRVLHYAAPVWRLWRAGLCGVRGVKGATERVLQPLGSAFPG